MGDARGADSSPTLTDKFLSQVAAFEAGLEKLSTPDLQAEFAKIVRARSERIRRNTDKNPASCWHHIVDQLPLMAALALIDRLWTDPVSWRRVLNLIEALSVADQARLFRAIEKKEGGAVSRATFDRVCERYARDMEEANSHIEENVKISEANMETAFEVIRELKASKPGPKWSRERLTLLAMAKALNRPGNSYAKMLGLINEVAKEWKLDLYSSAESLKVAVCRERRDDPARFDKEVRMVLDHFKRNPPDGTVSE